MLGVVVDRRLDPVLRGVSRSIFLTLRVAPRAMRGALGVGYLFCRAADTIADTRLLPPAERLGLLELFRAQFFGNAPAPGALGAIAARTGPVAQVPAERELLLRLDECFVALGRLPRGDRELLRRLVTTLTGGMRMDLETFPAEESGEVAALASAAELDLYTYYVAGCVGEFWTDLQLAHIPALARWDPAARRPQGVRFGKGLQMTNILRDVDRDLALGRCYFPATELAEVGAELAELRAGRQRARLRPLLARHLAATLAHYRAGRDYTLAVPRSVPRLRLACAWPLLLGLRTLALLAASEDPYAPGSHHKIARREVAAILRASTRWVLSDRRLAALFRRLEDEVAVRVGAMSSRRD